MQVSGLWLYFSESTVSVFQKREVGSRVDREERTGLVTLMGILVFLVVVAALRIFHIWPLHNT